ncbi:MAG: nucleoside/nucleotide kinase family protein [Planctomycetota bacterium]|jgi:dCMP deaminase
MVVIGITGRNCAGKDSVAAILVARGFERHSLSDAIREELRARDVPITREALIDMGNRLRRDEGPAVLAERMKRMIRGDRVALVSVRSPSEVQALRALPGFRLVGVEAPVAVRFERERTRSREFAVETLEEFIDIEERENTTDPEAQQLDATLALADTILQNDGTLDDLQAKVLSFVGDEDD